MRISASYDFDVSHSWISLRSYYFWRNRWKQQGEWRRSLISMWVFQMVCFLCFRKYFTRKNMFIYNLFVLYFVPDAVQEMTFKSEWKDSQVKTYLTSFTWMVIKSLEKGEIRYLNEKPYWNILRKREVKWWKYLNTMRCWLVPCVFEV